MRFRSLALYLTIAVVVFAQSSPFSEVPIATDDPISVATDDMNRDGNPDLLVVSYSAGTVSILFGDGQGHFSADPSGPVSVGPVPLQVATGDFNKDGNTDFAVLHESITTTTNGSVRSVGAVSAFFHSGAGFVPYSANPLLGASYPGASLFVRDLDADGDLDILLTDRTASMIFRGDGAGSFGSRIIAGAYRFPSGPSVIADFNGDGKLELAAIQYDRSAFDLYSDYPAGGQFDTDLSQPMSSINAQPFGSPKPWQLTGIATGDFDSDGIPDLLVGDRYKHTVYPWLGSVSGLRSWPNSAIWSTFQPWPYGAGNISDSPFSLAVADFDLDGRLDFASASSTGSSIYIGINFPPGFSTARGAPYAVSQAPYALATGDFNKDGRPDLVYTHSGGVTVLLNNGSLQPLTPRTVQTITFNLPTTVPQDSSPLTLGGSASSTSGLPVSYIMLQSTGVCSISNDTVLTLFHEGVCTVTAYNNGNSTYQPASVDRSINVTAAQTINVSKPADVNIAIGHVDISFSSTAGLPVTAASTTTSICSISDHIVTLLATGTCTLTFTQAGNTTYPPASATVSFNILPAGPRKPQSIRFGAIQDRPLNSGPILLASLSYSALIVTFTSSTPATCAIDGSQFDVEHNLNLLAVGTCTVTATQAGDINWAPAQPVTHTFYITNGTPIRQSQTITFAELVGRALNSSSVTLSATTTSGLPVTFSSYTPPVCSVNGNTVVLLTTGECVIDASQEGNATYTSAPDVVRTFVITPAVTLLSQTIQVPNLSDHPISIGGLGVGLLSSAGLPVTIASATPSTCSFNSQSQFVAFLQVGVCTLTFSQPGNATYSPAPTVTGSFTILPAPGSQLQTIAFAPIPDRLLSAGGFALSATASSSLAVTFSSVTPATCSVQGTTVILITTGTCTITASQTGNSTYSAAPSVSRSFQITAATLQPQTITFAPLPDRPLSAGPFTLSATASSGLAVTFSSGTPTTCSLQGATVQPLAAGICSIAAFQSGNLIYAAAPLVSQTFKITNVSSSAPTITSVVNAAGYATGVAPNSYVATFGKNFGPSPSITIRDAIGTVLAPTLVYASDTQINFVWPATAIGAATLTVDSAGTNTSLIVAVANTIPGLFSADSSGQGPAAANVIIVNADKSITTRLVADGPIPVLAGADIYLVLYGTGIRAHAPNAVIARVAGRPVDVLYAGAQGQFPGLDQVNLRIPLTVGGFGTVEIQLTVDGSLSNTVTANFQ